MSSTMIAFVGALILVAVAFALITGGGVGVAVRGLRKWPGWFRA